VKRPRPPAAVAGFPPDNLGQDFPRIAALSDDVAVISVRAENIIFDVKASQTATPVASWPM